MKSHLMEYPNKHHTIRKIKKLFECPDYYYTKEFEKKDHRYFYKYELKDYFFISDKKAIKFLSKESDFSKPIGHISGFSLKYKTNFYETKVVTLTIQLKGSCIIKNFNIEVVEKKSNGCPLHEKPIK